MLTIETLKHVRNIEWQIIDAAIEAGSYGSGKQITRALLAAQLKQLRAANEANDILRAVVMNLVRKNDVAYNK